MTALICGSVAYDTVMVFDGHFKDHILADRIHMLNVAFLVPALRRNFGGCAGNIGYNLKLIGGDGRIMATVGIDFAPYRAWMKDCGLSTEFIREMADEYTAQAYITTDADNNQITAFHPGAMNHAHVNHVPKAAGLRLGIVAPENRDGMKLHAEQFAAAGIPFIFDPGQGMTLFNGEELSAFIDKATWVAANDYEASLLCERTGRSLEQIAAQGQGADRHARRRGVAHLCRRASARDPGRASRARSPTRPAAATPTAPACCTGCRRASTGRRSAASPR